jgi:hypothetical protein
MQATKPCRNPKNSHAVIVARGNELHGFSQLNRAPLPDVYDR